MKREELLKNLKQDIDNVYDYEYTAKGEVCQNCKRCRGADLITIKRMPEKKK